MLMVHRVLLLTPISADDFAARTGPLAGGTLACRPHPLGCGRHVCPAVGRYYWEVPAYLTDGMAGVSMPSPMKKLGCGGWL
jgi:hypothetical protein